MNLSPALAQHLPETHALLQAANLTLHPGVARVILHGSRGLAGGARPESDIDLSLIVDLPARSGTAEIEDYLQAVLITTRAAWRSDVELDLAVVFELRDCSLQCFTRTRWHDGHCAIGGRDCFGLYKLGQGFAGLVTNAGIEVRRMYPCLEICRRPGSVPGLPRERSERS